MEPSVAPLLMTVEEVWYDRWIPDGHQALQQHNKPQKAFSIGPSQQIGMKNFHANQNAIKAMKKFSFG
jgi:hypothetical protein